MNDRLHDLNTLMREIHDHTAAGRPVPCTIPDRAHWWLADDPEMLAAAAQACRTCPALATCRSYVDEHPERAGVWAGQPPAQRWTAA